MSDDPRQRPDGGTAGASARREHERRRTRREARQAEHEAEVRARHPRIAGLILALAGTSGAPQHERVWAQGAIGEERVAQTLAARCPEIPVLHDRRLPGRRANVDHIAIAPSGVWVIDTKRYVNKKIAVNKPLFGHPSLMVGGRDQTKLLDGLGRQMEAVTLTVTSCQPGVPVHGCLCFVDGDWGLFGRPARINGLAVAWPKALAKWLNQDGPLADKAVVSLTQRLAETFAAA